MTCRHRAGEGFHNHNGTDKKTDLYRQTKLDGLDHILQLFIYLFKNFLQVTFPIRDKSDSNICPFMYI